MKTHHRMQADAYLEAAMQGSRYNSRERRHEHYVIGIEDIGREDRLEIAKVHALLAIEEGVRELLGYMQGNWVEEDPPGPRPHADVPPRPQGGVSKSVDIP